MDGLKKKDKKSKSKKTKATQWETDSLQHLGPLSWPVLSEEMGKGLYSVCHPTWLTPCSPKASETLFIHQVAALISHHILHGNVSSSVARCSRWWGTETLRRTPSLVLQNQVYSSCVTSGVQSVGPNHSLPSSLFNCQNLYLCCIYSQAVSCAATF